MMSFISEVSLLVFYPDALSICDIGILKSPTIIMLESFCVFKSNSVCLMKLGALTFSTYLPLLFPPLGFFP
jgi:hypothetical protein